MQMVKVQIPDKDESAKAFVEMARRGRIVCLPDDVYVVPEPAVALLHSLGITFRELGRGGYGYAETALRDSSPSPVQ
jgi:hypothetical protein